jgi:hypothetical protein
MGTPSKGIVKGKRPTGAVRRLFWGYAHCALGNYDALVTRAPYARTPLLSYCPLCEEWYRITPRTLLSML